jgi:hypothetical protein
LTFRRHVESGTASKIGGIFIRGCQAKVGEFDSHPAISDQNILWFEVAMIDSQGVAILDSVQDLEKSSLGQDIISYIVAMFGDTGEQVTFGAKLDDNVDAVERIHNTDKGNHVRMLAGQVM